MSFALGAISLTKYLGLAFEDVATAPHFYLILLVLPVLVSLVGIVLAMKVLANR